MANPVLLKEFRTRLRSKKNRTIQLAIGIPAAVVILLSYIRLLVGMFSIKHENGEIWLACAMLQLGIMSFITPGLLANAITQEKEQRTWGLLLITRLSSWQIISGKLFARLVPIPIIMVLFVPFMAFSAKAAHMRWQVMAGTYGILFAALLLFAIQALFWSWLLKRTSSATAASYGLVFLLTIGTYVVNELIKSMHRYSSDSAVLCFNPFYVLARVTDTSGTPGWGYVTPMDAMNQMTIFLYAYVSVSLIMLVVMKGWLGRTQTD